jgi:hypothetical protein
MRFNFRVGWFRVEVSPKPKVVFDVRRTVAGKTEKKKPNKTIKSVSGKLPKKGD